MVTKLWQWSDCFSVLRFNEIGGSAQPQSGHHDIDVPQLVSVGSPVDTVDQMGYYSGYFIMEVSDKIALSLIHLQEVM